MPTLNVNKRVLRFYVETAKIPQFVLGSSYMYYHLFLIRTVETLNKANSIAFYFISRYVHSLPTLSSATDE